MEYDMGVVEKIFREALNLFPASGALIKELS
jgi:hypothetical protein